MTSPRFGGGYWRRRSSRAQVVGADAEPVYHLILRNHAEDRVLSRRRVGRGRRLTCCTGSGSPRPAMTGAAGGWRSGMPTTTCTSSATLARQDGGRIWPRNDFYRVREGCRAAEKRYGLSVPDRGGDRTADPRATRAEPEKAARAGRREPARETLARLVRTTAAGSESLEEFVARVGASGGVVHLRESSAPPGRSPATPSGCPATPTGPVELILYSGGRLAAELDAAETAGPLGSDPAAEPATLCAAEELRRGRAEAAAHRAAGVEEFFSLLAQDGLLVRRRESQQNPGQLHTGYAVAVG